MISDHMPDGFLHCGGGKSCRRSDPSQAENPVKNCKKRNCPHATSNPFSSVCVSLYSSPITVTILQNKDFDNRLSDFWQPQSKHQSTNPAASAAEDILIFRPFWNLTNVLCNIRLKKQWKKYKNSWKKFVKERYICALLKGDFQNRSWKKKKWKNSGQWEEENCRK